MSRQLGRSRSTWQVAAVTAVLALATACGSAVPHDQVVQAARGGLTAGTAAADGSTPDGAGGTGPAAGDPAAAAGGAAAGGAAGAAGAAGTAAGAAGPAAGAAAKGASGAAARAAGTAAGAVDKSPIKVASVGDYSGAPGSLLKSSAIGAQVWAAEVNAKGGIAGHPVQVVVADDQSDPSRYRSLVQDLVENQHVVAFIGQAAAQTIQSAQTYLEQKRVPVVGSGDGSPTWQNSPMHFPVAGNADALTYGDFAIAKAQGKTQIAVLSCVEASSCTGWKAAASKYAPKAGVTLTYTADISITQPDFTSECLNARNKGVQVMAVIADSNTLYRVARSCSQQNFKPTYIAPSPDDRDAANPALDGAIGAMHTFPYFGVGGSAVSDAFRAAVKKYAPDAPQQQYLATGYASGKVFEAAAAKAIGTGAPSSAKVLDGLWSLAQGETLGGLVLPLHYQKDKPTAMVFCYYPGIITGGRYTAPGGMRPTCATP